MKRCYSIRNVANGDIDLFVYGDIVSQKSHDWWTGEESKSDFALDDIKDAIANIKEGSNLNLYINSYGGDVFATSAMLSMLQRGKDTKKLNLTAYIDGVACSCASWLPMIADKIVIYRNSVMMIHKPISIVYGNADDFAKEIEVLNKIEEGVILPNYLDKAKVSKETLLQMMADETWLTADEIQATFNVEYVDRDNNVENSASQLYNHYKHVPDALKESSVKEEKKEDQKNFDYSDYIIRILHSSRRAENA